MDPWVEKEEKRERKKMKEHFDMIDFIADAHFGIPDQCPCGAGIVEEVSTNPNDKDFTPGRMYWTCRKFEDDGFHFRQPWVRGIEDEVRRLKREMDEIRAEIAELKMRIPRD